MLYCVVVSWESTSNQWTSSIKGQKWRASIFCYQPKKICETNSQQCLTVWVKPRKYRTKIPNQGILDKVRENLNLRKVKELFYLVQDKLELELEKDLFDTQ